MCMYNRRRPDFLASEEVNNAGAVPAQPQTKQPVAATSTTAFAPVPKAGFLYSTVPLRRDGRDTPCRNTGVDFE